jgi:hypothetical protein
LQGTSLAEFSQASQDRELNSVHPKYRLVAYNSSYMDVLLWLASDGCPMPCEIAEYKGLLRSYPDASEKFLHSTFDKLDGIKRKLRTP